MTTYDINLTVIESFNFLFVQNANTVFFTGNTTITRNELKTFELKIKLTNFITIF